MTAIGYALRVWQAEGAPIETFESVLRATIGGVPRRSCPHCPADGRFPRRCPPRWRICPLGHAPITDERHRSADPLRAAAEAGLGRHVADTLCREASADPMPQIPAACE